MAASATEDPVPIHVGVPPSTGSVSATQVAPATTNSIAETATVYVIRHGEKKGKLGSLDAQGRARAEALIGIFNGEKYATPKTIIGMKYKDCLDGQRCIQLVTPIANHLGLEVITDYGVGFCGIPMLCCKRQDRDAAEHIMEMVKAGQA